MPEIAFDVPTPSSNAAEFSVSELASAIKRTLEDGFGHVRLRGEISGYRGPHASGHCYFALKDERAKIDSVIWRGAFSKLKIKPEEGMEVIVQGRITTYPNSSKYQIVIDTLEPAGVGALMALLEERKKKYSAEGLFDDSRKRKFPFLPKVIGVVTSPTGAVIRDMMHGFNERCPAHVIVWPVRVQGENSAAEIAAAIHGFNQLDGSGLMPRPDILIVARGGGSLEDLWSFNEDIVVRAAADSIIPLIAAVGHETDWTLIDLVADARAPTPTKAAEWAVPKFSEIAAQTDELHMRLKTGVRRRFESARTNLRAAIRGLPRLQDLVALPRQRFDAAERHLVRSLLNNTQAHNIKLMTIAGRFRPALLLGRIEKDRTALTVLQRRSLHSCRQSIGIQRIALAGLTSRLSLEFIRARIVRNDERRTALAAGLDRAFRQCMANCRTSLNHNSKLLTSLGYQSVLGRGFAVVRDRSSGQAIKSKQRVADGARLEIEFRDGRIDATALHGSDADSSQKQAASAGRSRRPRTVRSSVKAVSKAGSGQGSLF
ncbi:MAG: exodeoxyribonuclease VII large subunit [Pseudomonadota bacterium]